MASALERAARAACKADGHDPDGPVCDIYIHDDPAAGKPWAGYRNIARAVLMAVRDAVANDMGNDLWSFQDPEAFCIVMRSILNEKDTTND